MKNFKIRWEFTLMLNKVRLIEGAQDTFGKPLSTDKTYYIVGVGKYYSILEDDDNKQYYVNVKYIEKI